MTARENYDNPALSTGVTVGAIAADFEAQVLANRKRVLMNAAQAADFRSSVYQQMVAFNNANREAAQKAAAEAIGFAQREMERAYNAGRARIDQNVRAYEKQGYRAEEHKTHSDFLLNAAMYTVAGGISGAINTALESAHSQLLGVAALVNTDTGDIYREIDRVQANYLRKGLSGAHRVGGSKMELSSAVELQVRDDSQRTLLKAQGERSSEYGLYLIQISAHPSSCPLCLPWQTRVLIDDVNNDGKADGKHELLSTAMSAGLYHYNCRHSYIVYIEGYSRNDIFDYDRASKELTADRYATEQEQRYNERQIRQWKRVEAGAVSEKEREFAAQKKQLWQLRQRELEKYAEQNNLPFYRQYPREAIGGKTQPDLPTINMPIERNHAAGRPSAVIGGAELNKRQQRIDNALTAFDTRTEVKKKDVSMKDLAALTAKNGVEYSLFTKGQTRLIIRGDEMHVQITDDVAREMGRQGWRWTGHTHVGTASFDTTPSDGDLKILKEFGQQRSAIYLPNGKWKDFKVKK